MARRAKTQPLVPPSEPAPPEQTFQLNTQDALPRDNTPDIFIDAIGGVSMVNGVLRMSCYAFQPTASNEQKTVLVLRLAMGIPTLLATYQGFGHLLTELEKRGIITKSDPA